jgi:hypothetical protein
MNLDTFNAEIESLCKFLYSHGINSSNTLQAIEYDWKQEAKNNRNRGIYTPRPAYILALTILSDIYEIRNELDTGRQEHDGPIKLMKELSNIYAELTRKFQLNQEELRRDARVRVPMFDYGLR